MLINLKVKTLDAQTHEFTGINNEITVRDFKDQIAEKTGIAPDQQRIIYCGRVLADDKHLKDYDVDGKVLHVAERPPPLQRAASASSSATSIENNNTRSRPSHHNMRNSPLFRALDGMVVGTMAIPMNGGNMHNGPTALHPLTASSSFCMNRITVARHMLNCVNNIAAYLEDPSRGLNNVPLDILARGRWTMESTVVEVGITATDLPQSQNIVEMVQGAVSAAFRRNGNTNVTVVQLPTMFSSSEGEQLAAGAELNAATGIQIPDNNATSGGGNESLGSGSVSDTGTGEHHATVIIEDILPDIDDATTNASSHVAQAGSATSSDSGSSSVHSNGNSTSTTDGGIGSTSVGTNTDDNIQSRRTGTTVLAEVFEQMRTVWARIDPFIQQAQEMLQNEPTFDENDTTGRENAQRLFDRVSEAFHYLSHAQHAISDLMLDYGQPTPRYLTCRPILVEQSGYVSSNSYMSAAAAAAAAANAFRQSQGPILQQQQQQQQQQQTGNLTNPVTQATSATPPTTADDGENMERNGNSSSNNIEEDPLDALLNVTATRGATNSTTSTSNAGTQSTDNHQLQMARLIQAVVNSAPVDTEFHVQINAPSIVSFGMPMGAIAAAHGTGTNGRNNRRFGTQSTGNNNSSTDSNSDTPTSTTAAPTTASTTAPASVNNTSASTAASVPSIGSQIRVNTVTLPTTSTQTRSTSRPQVQIGNLPTSNLGGGNGGRMVAPQMSAFDRFLPCNSHHIRESNEHTNNDNSASNNSTNSAPRTSFPGGAAAQNQANATNRAATRILSDLIRRPSLTVGSTMSAPRASAAPYTRRPTTTTPTSSSSSAASPSATSNANASTGTDELNDHRISLSSFWDSQCNNLRSQLVEFLNETLFEGLPMNEANMDRARNRAIDWFSHHLLYLRQYEKPGYDSQDSVLNILRKMWPLFIEVLTDRQAAAEQYEGRVKLMCKQFVTRLYSVLIVCIGRENADLFWGQLMRHLAAPVKLRFRTEACQFLLCFITTEIPATTDIDDAGQFITHRRTDGEASEINEKVNSTANEIQLAITTDSPNFDTEMLELASTSSSNQSDLTTSNSNDATLQSKISSVVELPKINVGSESWHNSFPNLWLPLLTRDVQFQAQHPSTQSPFSDGYISGAPAKRRKTIQNSKAPTDFKSLVASTVREAIQTATATPSSSSGSSSFGATAAAVMQSNDVPSTIIAAITEDPTVQNACKDAARANMRERFKKDEDYEPDRFPVSTKFVEK